MRKLISFLPLSMLVLFSCSEFSLFTPQVESAEGIEIRSLTEGGSIGSGESISFVIHSSQDTELDLDIELTTDSGESVWVTSISAPLVNEELELILPELASGLYTLNFLIRSAAGTNVEETIRFFYTDGVYAITGINSFPPTAFIGSQTLLQADIQAPEESNPYIRWTQDGNLIAKGTLSEGTDQITWSAPAEAGVYSIQVELFPFAPTDGTEYGFGSSISMSARLYVSLDQSLSESDLVPESSYYSLFHFNGNLVDSGFLGQDPSSSGSEEIEAQTFGAPRFITAGDQVGYHLDQESGIQYSRMIFPLDSGFLQPFTLTLALSLDSSLAAGDILKVNSADGSFEFRLAADSDSGLYATMKLFAGSIEFASGIENLSSGEAYQLSVSFIPGDGSVTAIWFLDGIQTATVVRAVNLNTIGSTGETIVGGTDFSGIISELGVYYQDTQSRPTVDPDIYRRAMSLDHGPNLIYAEGFDGLYLASAIDVSGEAGLTTGILNLDPGSSLHLPAFELEGDQTIVEIKLAALPPVGSTVMVHNEESLVLELSADGLVVLENREYSLAPLGQSLRLIFDQDALTIFSSQANPPLALEDLNIDSWVELQLNAPENEGLDVDSILMVH